MRGPSLLDQVLFEVWFVACGATAWVILRVASERLVRGVWRRFRPGARS